MNRLYRVDDIDRNLRIAGFRPLDVLVVGGTGVGKSSTINALFEKEIAKVGRGCEPETMDVGSMELNRFLRFWDSPGLGDNKERDRRYKEDLIDLLYKEYHQPRDNKRFGVIDTMKGKHWDENLNCPDEVLLEFLENKADSVKRRLFEATGAQISKPVYYSAERGYNIEMLLDMVIDRMPKERRRVVA